MKRNDYILTIAAGFLSVPYEKQAEVTKYFEQRFELHEAAKPNVVSLGGELNKKQLSFVEWVLALRNEDIQDVCFYWGANEDASLPPHVASAFAGVQELLLQVTTEQGVRTYLPQSYSSSQYEITTAQFIELIDSQKNSEALWARVAELLLESNAMNNRSAFDSSKVREYLVTTEGIDVLAYMLGQLMQEVQIESVIADVAFEIPEHLASLFYKSSFSFGGSDKTYVYLYPVDEVSAQDVIDLVQAQSFHGRVWERCEKYFAENSYAGIPALKADQWENALKGFNKEDLASAANGICRVICELCEETDVKRVIPDHLKELFGPDDLEEKRAQARSKINDTQWYLESCRNPWELYYFGEIAGGNMQRADLAVAGDEFAAALNEIAAFAKTIDSPFTEAFLLAKYLMADVKPHGSFDEAHLAAIKADLKVKGFSERAVENFANSFYYSEDLLKLDWQQERIYGFLAHDIADVFGGMGSWNDQYMEDESQQETYGRVSANVFKTMKTYFAALISG